VNRVGIDIGGTHTDIVVVDDGVVRLHKVPSNNVDPSEAVLRGLGEMGLSLSETELFAHGTTVATNAVIQRTGAATGLVTTTGFRDVLQIRRTTRGELYDFQWDPPAELVPRRWRREVDERVAADGTVLRELDEAGLLEQVRALVADGVAAIAVAFINSYRNPANERAARDVVAKEFPELPVYLSAELLPAWREFERTSTASVGAYVGPVLTEYLRRMEGSLTADGYRSDLLVMQSNGGLGTAESAIDNPVSTLMSGPAAGVIAQIAIAGVSGITDLVGMDIGGTSTDISVVIDGRPQMRSEFDIEFGTVVGFPMIDINSIAAGGGTVAWLDDGGMLHSGPRSAGAMPGPACYGRGGTEPTLTDAYVATGRLSATHLLGGSMAIDASLSEQAVSALGARVGLGTEEMAAGVVALTVSNISSAIREMTVERGLNPRDLTLVAYGGGGPTLAVDVAVDLDLSAVLVPRNPGLTSASGLLMTDVRHDYVRTFLRRNDESDAADVQTAFDELLAEGARKLDHEDIPTERQRFELAADLRYIGQTHELTIALGTSYDDDLHATLSDALRVDHLKSFGHAPDGVVPVEIVSVRVAAIGEVPRVDFGGVGGVVDPAPTGRRRLWHDGAWHDASLYARTDLGPGSVLVGPAIVEQLDTTTVVPPGWQAGTEAAGSLLLTRAPAS
jgi:N-methylhydantoinase A